MGVFRHQFTLGTIFALLSFIQTMNGQQCVGLRGLDGGTVNLLPTQSTTVYPYAINCQTGQPIANYNFTFHVQGVDNTGGHMHPHSGTYLQPSGTVSPTSCTTDANGNCPGVTYTASYVGQQEILLPTSNTLIYVRYQDIYQYNPSNPGYVSLVGARTEHPSNHYGTVTLGNGVNGVASSWYTTYGTPLAVNDMGLTFGGWFDLNQNWSCPHQYHGRGTAVDFNGAPPNSAQAQNLASWCPANNLTRTYSETTNYHCEAADNINRFLSSSCPTSPGATPPNGLSSLQ